MNRKLIINTGCVLGALLGVGLVQYYLFRQKKASEIVEIKPQEPKPLVRKPDENLAKKTPLKPKIKISKSEGITKPILASDFPLKLGSKGEYVTELQVYLLKNHGWEDVKMGVFDQLTQERVKRFLKVTEIDRSLYEKITGKAIK